MHNLKTLLIDLGVTTINSLKNSSKKNKLYVDYFNDIHKQKFIPALEKLEELESLSPKDPIIYINKGYILADLEQYSKGIENLEKALELINNSFLELISDYFKIIMPRQGVMYRQMLKSACLNNIGVLLLEIERYEESEEKFKLSHAEYKKSPYPLLGLANLSIRKKDKERTLLLLEKAIELMDPPMIFTYVIINLITHEDFKEYQEFLLETALRNRIINRNIYKKYQNILIKNSERQLVLNKNKIGFININSNILGVQVGFHEDSRLGE